MRKNLSSLARCSLRKNKRLIFYVTNIIIVLMIHCLPGAYVKAGVRKTTPSVSLFQNRTENQFTVKGKVTDETGKPLSEVTVSLKGSSIGTITDANGMYFLQLPEKNGTLVFSYIGYEKNEIPITERSEINVMLVSSAATLNQVVVVGYGKQKKETVTGAISSVGNKELTETPVANISNALVGRVPGLTATQASGEPGQNAATIRIRGASTLNSSGQSPLIVIDGIQTDSYTFNLLDPNEVESISVLKDASATAVYGVKGANGVIIVKTKRGIAGRQQINFSSNYGVTQLSFPLKMLGSYNYALYRNEAIQTDGDPSFNNLLFSNDELWKFKNDRDYTPEEVKAMNLTQEQKINLMKSPALYYTSHDWFDEQFGHPGPQKQYNLNITGGSDKVRYFTSLGYFSQQGSIANSNYGGANANSDYDRYNFRSNFDIDAAKNLQVSLDIAGQISDFKGILGKDGDITSQFSRNKEMTVLLAASSPYAGPGIIDNHLVTDFVAHSSPLQGKGGDGFSPTAYVLEADYMKSRTSNLHTGLVFRHTMDYLTQGFSVHGTISYDDRYTKGRRFFPSIPEYTATRNPDNPPEILFLGGSTGPTSITDDYRNNKWRRFYLEGAVNYDRSFNKHAVTGLVLFNAQKTYDPELLYNVPTGLMGIVSRATYNYNERYLAEFDMGYNGSENFPPGNRFGFFPAVSAGWIVSHESFFPKNKWVNWIKIRGSYGEVGNDQIGGRRYLYLPSTWGYDAGPLGGYYFGTSNGGTQNPYYTGASESTVGNPNVTWERAKKYNIGLDIRLFSSRLIFSGDYFHENRDNILWPLGTVPALVGANLPPVNLGKVSNHGYEMQFEWNDRVNELSYFLKGNISYARNKIEYMDEPSFPYPWMNQTGFPLGQYKGYYNGGFYNNPVQANNRPYSTVDGNMLQPGDLRYIDINGDGVLDLKDQVPIGYSNLPEYAFNISLGFSYKGFSLSALFIGTTNGSLPLGDFSQMSDSPLINPFSRGNSGAMQWQYEGRWTPEKVKQGIEPAFPRASMRTATTENGLPSNFWLMSTDFLRLKNVEIGYSFNLKKIQWINIRSIRIYANGNNLVTFGSYLIDPEQEDAGAVSRGYLYPITRVYNLGVNVQF